MANSADSDQLASSEANRSGSTLFAKAGYIRFFRSQLIWIYTVCKGRVYPLLQKPTDLDLHCLQMQGISGLSRTRVKVVVDLDYYCAYMLQRFLFITIYNSSLFLMIDAKGMDTFSEEETLLELLFCSSEKGYTINGKKGSKLFPFIADLFSEGMRWAIRANRMSQKFSPS